MGCEAAKKTVHEIGRRQMTAALGSAAASLVLSAQIAKAGNQPRTKRHRARMVIDGLGELSAGPEPGSVDGNLSKAQLADIRRSELTAINVTVSPLPNGPGSPLDATIDAINWTKRQIAASPDLLMQIRSAADLEDALRRGRTGVIMGMQDTATIGTDLTQLERLASQGVRIVQLTYNLQNLVGSGCLAPTDAGLTPFGHDVIAELNRLRLVVDGSHGSERSIIAAAQHTNAPMNLSHTGCAALVNHPRNVSDAAMRAVARTGGVVGIYFMPFLRASGQAQRADVIRHIEHALQLCGEDHVAVGTDQVVSAVKLTSQFRDDHRRYVEERRRLGIAAPGEDPAVFYLVPEYNQPERLLTLADDLLRRGHSQIKVDKIIGGNLARVYSEIWG